MRSKKLNDKEYVSCVLSYFTAWFHLIKRVQSSLWRLWIISFHFIQISMENKRILFHFYSKKSVMLFILLYSFVECKEWAYSILWHWTKVNVIICICTRLRQKLNLANSSWWGAHEAEKRRECVDIAVQKCIVWKLDNYSKLNEKRSEKFW